jgi:DNA gyrase/topoisomerase IV subunit B
MSFTHGVADAPLRVTGEAGGETGTEVSFMPSTDTFTMVEFDYGTLEHRLRELAFLNSGVRIILTDARHADVKMQELLYDGGLEEFVKYLDRAKKPLIMPRRSPSRPSATASPSRSRCGGTTAITRTCWPSPTTSPSATAAPIWPVSVGR